MDAQLIGCNWPPSCLWVFYFPAKIIYTFLILLIGVNLNNQKEKDI